MQTVVKLRAVFHRRDTLEKSQSILNTQTSFISVGKAIFAFAKVSLSPSLHTHTSRPQPPARSSEFPARCLPCLPPPLLTRESVSCAYKKTLQSSPGRYTCALHDFVILYITRAFFSSCWTNSVPLTDSPYLQTSQSFYISYIFELSQSVRLQSIPYSQTRRYCFFTKQYFKTEILHYGH